MKRILALMCAAMLCACCLVLAACGGSGSSSAAASGSSASASASASSSAASSSAASTFVGDWKFAGMQMTTDSGTITMIGDLDAMASMFGGSSSSMTFGLSLKEDGTGSMNLLEAGIPLEWDNSDIIIQPKEGAAFTEPVRISYACEGESLKMSTSDYSLDFSRLNEQELAEYKENGAGSLKGQLSMVLQMLGANDERKQ